MLQSFILSILLLGFVTGSTENYTVKEHNFQVKGSSSLHDWEMNVNKVNVQSKIQTDQGKLKSIETLHLEIPIQGLLSARKSAAMDSKAHEALKKSKFPLIDFKLQEVQSISNAPGGGQMINAKGVLTIGGSQKTENISVHASVLPSGLIKFKGSKKLLMTDYNISPPKAMFNTLSTGNEVQIDFEIILSKI